jgi:N-methylhydantoinase A
MYASGLLPLNREAAERALRESVAEPLGLTVEEAAVSAHQVVNHTMVDAIREVSVRQGLDPREYALIAGGGASGLHVGELAEELGIPHVIVPRLASVLCALGCLLSDVRYEYSTTYASGLSELRLTDLNDRIDALVAKAATSLLAEGITGSQVTTKVSFDLRYAGQFQEVEVGIRSLPVDRSGIDAVADQFHSRHDELNGYRLPDHAIDLMAIRVVGVGSVGSIEIPEVTPVIEATDQRQYREIYVGGRLMSVPIFAADALSTSEEHVDGPAIVETASSTVYVPPSRDCVADRYGNIILRRRGVQTP